jgi:hypothetical protein
MMLPPYTWTREGEVHQLGVARNPANWAKAYRDVRQIISKKVPHRMKQFTQSNQRR